MRYQDVNAETIGRWVEQGWEWGLPVDHRTFEAAQRGDWHMVLTPTKSIPRSWLPKRLDGLDLLGLASGGGQQMPICAALGARCTVLDYTPAQLDNERRVAEREGYNITCIHADMTQPLPFPNASFDIIIHPVSNCYVRDVLPIWHECFRVLRPGGRLLSGLDNGISYMADAEGERIINALPFDPLVNPEHARQLALDDGGVQFSHTAEEQLRGQLQAGFILRDLYEDTYAEGRLHDLNIPTFWATLAIKPEDSDC